MRYVVGYTPTERGADAVALASAMARAQGAHLDLVYVVDRHTPYVAMNPEGNRVSAAEQQVLSAERQGMELVPEGLEAHFHVRQAESFAAGLIDAALEYRAGLIVVGAASNSLLSAIPWATWPTPCCTPPRFRWHWRRTATAGPKPSRV